MTALLLVVLPSFGIFFLLKCILFWMRAFFVSEVLADPIGHVDLRYNTGCIFTITPFYFQNLVKGFLLVSPDCRSMLFVLEYIFNFLCEVSHLVPEGSVWFFFNPAWLSETTASSSRYQVSLPLMYKPVHKLSNAAGQTNGTIAFVFGVAFCFLHLHLHLGFVHPLQDVALHQCLPLSSVCCFPNPGGSLLLC